MQETDSDPVSSCIKSQTEEGCVLDTQERVAMKSHLGVFRVSMVYVCAGLSEHTGIKGAPRGTAETAEKGTSRKYQLVSSTD